MWGALSNEGSVVYTCCWSSPAVIIESKSRGLASTVILESESCGTHDHILLSQTRGSPNLEGQVPVFTCISPRNRVAPLYTKAPGSLFLATYVSQG
jgi:hypothetical protein